MSLFSCITDDGITDIDDTLRPYYDDFAREAQARGIEVDYGDVPISASLSQTLNVNVAGTCLRRDNAENEIRINRNYWNSADELEREFVMFHELGHCFLNRDHTEETYPDGTCISIMASGTGSCDENYTELTRSDYLDELFN